MVRSPWDCREVTTLYLCDFMDTALAPCGNLAIAAGRVGEVGCLRLSQEPQSSYDFFCQTYHLKSCVVRTISARPLCGGRAGIVRCYLRCVYGLQAC